MTLEEVLELQDGDKINCGACGCDGSEVVVIRKKYLVDDTWCGCERIGHKGSNAVALVVIRCEEHSDTAPHVFAFKLPNNRKARWIGVSGADREKITHVEQRDRN